tara:strand:+ start:13617 stop:14348 length:732 start_codon:yes stop_codon:yes gene_type:complete
MALPKLNDVPQYTLTIPSTKQKISYRPFLVKEQKVLLMGLESNDDDQMVRSVVNTIEACVEDNINVKDLAMFDVEYMFLQIRGKSAGETAKVHVKCAHCEEQNELDITLDDIEVTGHTKDNKIKLNDQFIIEMRYPNYNSVVAKEFSKAKTMTDSVYKMIMICLDKLHTNNELINFDDYSEKEINDFVESLNTSQFEQIMNFVNDMPTIKKDLVFDCVKCEKENNYTLRGLQDFLFSASPMIT